MRAVKILVPKRDEGDDPNAPRTTEGVRIYDAETGKEVICTKCVLSLAPGSILAAELTVFVSEVVNEIPKEAEDE